MIVILAAIGIVAVTCAIHGAVGFGMNLMAVPVLALLDPVFVPGPMLVAGLALSTLIVLREPASVDRQVGWAVAGLVPGTLLAVVLLAAVPASRLTVPMGVLVLVAVAVSLMRVELRPGAVSLTGAGIASGFLATAASIGGPPMAMVYARSAGSRLRSNLAAFFIVSALFSIVALSVFGHFPRDAWAASALLLPGVVLGFLSSGPLRSLVDSGHTRPAVLTLSALAGVAAIVQGLLG